MCTEVVVKTSDISLSNYLTVENFMEEASESSSSSDSRLSLKQTCKVCKNRVMGLSTMSLDRNINHKKTNLNEKLSMIAFGRNNTITSRHSEPAQRMSLCVILESRLVRLTDSSDEDHPHAPSTHVQRFFNPKEIRQAFTAFKMYDANDEDCIGLHELKLALEKLSVPQTHLAARQLMSKFVGQSASKMNFYQFMLAYTSILDKTNQEAAPISSMWYLDWPKESIQISPPVAKTGVSGVKLFFETKIGQQSADLVRIKAGKIPDLI